MAVKCLLNLDVPWPSNVSLKAASSAHQPQDGARAHGLVVRRRRCAEHTDGRGNHGTEDEASDQAMRDRQCQDEHGALNGTATTSVAARTNSSIS